MNQAIIVYDNQCLFCSKSIRLVLKYDIKSHFKFTHFENSFSKKQNLSNNTVALILPNKQVLTEHIAVRYIIERLPKLRWTRIFFMLTPSVFQKFLYRIVAANRKTFFKSTHCSLDQVYRDRFIF